MKAFRKLYDAQKQDTIRDYINNAIAKYPDNTAFIIKNRIGKDVTYTNISYKEFGDDLKYLGTSLIDLGLEGKNIAIIGKNRYEWALSYVSILNGVGVAVPLDKGLPNQEIESLLVRSHAEAVIFEKEYMEVMKQIASNNNQIKHFVCMNPDTSDISDTSYGKFKSVHDLLETGKKLVLNGDCRFENHIIVPKELATIIFTSGTTSMAKAVMLSNYNIASNIYNMDMCEKILSTDINMAFLPLHHTFGSTGLLLFLSHGVTNVFCDGLRHIQENLKEYHVTVFVCVPLLLEAMYKKIYAQIDRQGKTKLIKFAILLSRFLLKFKIDIRRKLFKEILDNLGGGLRFVISGASAIDKNVARGFHDFGILTIQGYGLTETSPVLAAENEKSIKYGSVGVPLPEVDIVIDHPNEKGIGEIVVKGPNVMLGYYEMPEETEKILKNNWFYTGDLGYFDKDNFLFITGRKKNVIVLKNGKNIYPEELEQLINGLPYVMESMVFGMPKDDDLVLSVKIVYNKEYMMEKLPNLGEKEFKDYIWKDIKQINSTLANYKHIKNLFITDEPMIKTTTQKVKRYEEIKRVL